MGRPNPIGPDPAIPRFSFPTHPAPTRRARAVAEFRPLAELVEEYARHLDRESFFELM
jgi:hypothetical protein